MPFSSNIVTYLAETSCVTINFTSSMVPCYNLFECNKEKQRANVFYSS